jgi:hypothetical protein
MLGAEVSLALRGRGFGSSAPTAILITDMKSIRAFADGIKLSGSGTIDWIINCAATRPSIRRGRTVPRAAS